MFFIELKLHLLASVYTVSHKKCPTFAYLGKWGIFYGTLCSFPDVYKIHFILFSVQPLWKFLWLLKYGGVLGEHPVYGTTKLHNIITFGSHDESLRVLVIINLLMSLAVPTVPAVYALV